MVDARPYESSGYAKRIALLRTGARDRADNWMQAACEPVSISSMACLRVLFGALMLWEMVNYLSGSWIATMYVLPRFHSTYAGFGWVRPWPGIGMYVHFAVLAAAAAAIMLGVYARLAALVFGIGWAYVFLIERAFYINHHYLMILLSMLFVVLPADRAWSIDALVQPERRPATAPRWMLWLLRMQVGVVYVYSGVWKVTPEWLSGRAIRYIVGPSYRERWISTVVPEEWFFMLLTWGGMLFDLLIVPALLWRRTRVAAIVLTVVFHATNSVVFEIGIFPWLGIALTLVFVEPDWPTRWFGAAVRRRDGATAALCTAAPLAMSRSARALCIGGACYAVSQGVIPLRPFLSDDNPSWTGVCDKFAWRLMLYASDARGRFFAWNPKSQTLEAIDPDRYLSPSHLKRVMNEPASVVQFCRFLRGQRPDSDAVEIRAYVEKSLNGRPFQIMMDPRANLAAGTGWRFDRKWIVPLDDTSRAFGHGPQHSAEAGREAPHLRATGQPEQESIRVRARTGANRAEQARFVESLVMRTGASDY